MLVLWKKDLKSDHIVYKCPICGYIVSDLHMKYVRYNFWCARCGLKKLSEFKRIEI